MWHKKHVGNQSVSATVFKFVEASVVIVPNLITGHVLGPCHSAWELRDGEDSTAGLLHRNKQRNPGLCPHLPGSGRSLLWTAFLEDCMVLEPWVLVGQHLTAGFS